VEYFGGRLYRCVFADTHMPLTHASIGNATNVLIANRIMCEELPYARWENPPFNFDNIIQAGMTLFHLSVSGWVDVMESVVDITAVDQSPDRDNSSEYVVYFVLFHVVFSFFLLNLFIGVLSSAFSAQSGNNLITNLQRKWIRAMKMVETFCPADSKIDRPDSGVVLYRIRQRLWDLAENRYLEWLWTANILANVAVLTADHYPSTAEWSAFVEIFNTICLLLFTVEFMIKVVGYGLYSFLAR
jgi:hypothetical protein